MCLEFEWKVDTSHRARWATSPTCQIEIEILFSEVEKLFYSLFCLCLIVFVCCVGISCFIPRPRQTDLQCSRLHSLWQQRCLRSRGLCTIKIWSEHSQALWVKCVKFKWWNPLVLRVHELVIKRSRCIIYPSASLRTSRVDNNHWFGLYLPPPLPLCYLVSNIKGVITNPSQIHELHYHTSRHPSCIS